MFSKQGLGWMLVLSLLMGVEGAKAASGQTCMDEVRKWCPNQAPGEGLADCVRLHKKEFSEACQTKGEGVRNQIRTAFRDCKGDFQAYCKEVRPGGGRVLKCMRDHQEKLSVACRGHLEGLN